jgi:hypothetical protein
VGKCTFDLYKRCSSFIATRCFGWGLPTTIVVPIADSFNHSAKTNNILDLVNKRLHLLQNKIYGYHFNFDVDSSSKNAAQDDLYDKSSSKFVYNIKRVFKEDEGVKNDPELAKLIDGEQLTPEMKDEAYNESEVFNRFKNLMRSEIGAEEFESEETKKEKFSEHGVEIWGIGYISSDHEPDNDESDLEEDAGA